MSWRFKLPSEARTRPWFAVASVAAHAVLVVLLVWYSGPSFVRTVTFVDLGGGPGDVRQVELPFLSAGEGGQGRSQAVADSAVGDARDIALVPPRRVPVGIPDPSDGQRAAERGTDSLDLEQRTEVAPLGSGPGRRILVPRLGDGRLWVRARDAIAAAIAGAFEEGPADPETHAARIDSAIATRLYAFLDTLPRDSMTVARPPDWVTEIDGQQWGIDGSWIYLGGLKLPTAILALLPIPQGNFEQGRHAAELQRIREDILSAARRAETAEQFRRYVDETRARRDAERERERNQRILPDSIKT